MTEIAFHFNAPNLVDYACRLLHKAVGRGAKVLVVADACTLNALDIALWTYSMTEFLPHCTVLSDPKILAKSPVLLAQSAENSPHTKILLNLGLYLPDGFELFERVIDVVSQNDDSRHLARIRWKQYRDLGYEITRHDLQLKQS